MNRYLVFGILYLVFSLSIWTDVFAQERGIGVSPAKIEIAEDVEWPYTTPLFVTNLSESAELYEVTFENTPQGIVSASPGRFRLASGDTGRVLLNFENPQQEVTGLIRVVASRYSPEGFETGAGLKIPFHIAGERVKGEERVESSFLASVGDAFRNNSLFSWIFGILAILMAIVFLWYLALYVIRRAESSED